jgi:hypothetical protein
LNLAHLELGKTVGKKDGLPDTDILEEVWITDGKNPVFGLTIDPERYGRPNLEVNALLRELTEPDLGASKILKDADFAVE